MLFFEAPTQPDMMIDDTLRLVVCTWFFLDKFLVNQFAPSLPNQSWYGQVISLKLN